MVAANIILELLSLKVQNFTIGAQRWDTDFNTLSFFEENESAFLSVFDCCLVCSEEHFKKFMLL